MTHLEALKQEHPNLEYHQGEIYEKGSNCPIETDGDRLIEQHYAFAEFDILVEQNVSVKEYITTRFDNYKIAFNEI